MVRIVPYLMFAWFPVVFLLFARLPKHRAVLVAFIAGVLFLPGILDKKINADAPDPVPVPYFPLTKQNTICLAILLATAAVDRRRLLAFRPGWVDVPMLLWCLCPFFSSLANDPPPDGTSPGYDGFSQARAQTLTWGVPWFIGRLYFTDVVRFRELLLGIVWGGLVYVPFCLVESRLSPQFHKWVYGYEQHDFIQAVRPDGYRPTVFMEHGLAVGMWLVAAALTAFGLWCSGAERRLPVARQALSSFWLWWSGGEKRFLVRRSVLPMAGAALVLLATSVIIKSTGALALGALGVVALMAARRVGVPLALAILLVVPPLYIFGRTSAGREATGWLRRVGVPLALAILLVVPPLYIFGRTSAGREATGWLRMKFSKWETEDEAELESLERKALLKPMVGWGWWSTEDVVEQISESSNSDRAKSLEFRLINEDRLMERAAERPWFGWGGWNRAAILITEDPEQPDKDMVTADGYWIITLANRGWFGLAAVYAAMLLPVVRLMFLHPWRPGGHTAYAPAAVAAVFLTIYMIDNLSNAMFNPVYVLLAGALAGWRVARRGCQPRG
jgi:hypothetical protein